MQKMMDLLDNSKQLNLEQGYAQDLPYHAQRGRFKIIHQGLMIPNLPAPLHYLNFLSIIGQPNAPMLRNPSAIQTHPLDTATVMSSVSGKMTQPLYSYSIAQQCQFNEQYFQFGQVDQVTGNFPHFIFQRQSADLSYHIEVTTGKAISHFTKLKIGVFDHWSILSHCKGEVIYQDQEFQIDQLGAFEYARAVNLPYLPLSFFTYQIINLDHEQQLLLAQIRNQFNQIVQSRAYLRHINGQTKMFDHGVKFKVHRLYPAVTTPNGKRMYLPREMSWTVEQRGRVVLHVHASSRGDFKFGLAAGYVGSYQYEVSYKDRKYVGESGYCEYIDCRKLLWQEIDQPQANIFNQLKTKACVGVKRSVDEINDD